MDKFRIDLNDLLISVSNAQGLVSPELFNHQQMVAYLSFRIAEKLMKDENACREVLLASLIHDVGALTEDEIANIVKVDYTEDNLHSYRGALLFDNFKPMKKIARLIRYHHTYWNYGNWLGLDGEKIPREAQIIHLADRVSIAVSKQMGSKNNNVFTVVESVISMLKNHIGNRFDQETFKALEDLSKIESVWLDLISKDPISHVPLNITKSYIVLDIDDIITIASIFAQIIDFRSGFTSRHSAGVATTAHKLAVLAGLSPLECKMMLIAGYLHDLGKIAIPSSILEKPDKLDDNETKIMRSHTYYTYKLLSEVKEFDTINKWAAFHHERLDGNGYPFHIEGENLTLGSRIMAVADIFTAITENRPYRIGMKDETAIKVLRNMAKTGGIDPRITTLLISNFNDINNLRSQAQTEAAIRYQEFMDTYI